MLSPNSMTATTPLSRRPSATVARCRRPSGPGHLGPPRAELRPGNRTPRIALTLFPLTPIVSEAQGRRPSAADDPWPPPLFPGVRKGERKAIFPLDPRPSL